MLLHDDRCVNQLWSFRFLSWRPLIGARCFPLYTEELGRDSCWYVTANRVQSRVLINDYTDYILSDPVTVYHIHSLP